VGLGDPSRQTPVTPDPGQASHCPGIRAISCLSGRTLLLENAGDMTPILRSGRTLGKAARCGERRSTSPTLLQYQIPDREPSHEIWRRERESPGGARQRVSVTGEANSPTGGPAEEPAGTVSLISSRTGGRSIPLPDTSREAPRISHCGWPGRYDTLIGTGDRDHASAGQGFPGSGPSRQGSGF